MINIAILAAGIDPYDADATAPHEIISFTSSFHGRTMGALALTYKQQYKTPFAPMIGGTSMVKWLDFDAIAQAVQKARPSSCLPPLSPPGPPRVHLPVQCHSYLHP